MNKEFNKLVARHLRGDFMGCLNYHKINPDEFDKDWFLENGLTEIFVEEFHEKITVKEAKMKIRDLVNKYAEQHP